MNCLPAGSRGVLVGSPPRVAWRMVQCRRRCASHLPAGIPILRASIGRGALVAPSDVPGNPLAARASSFSYLAGGVRTCRRIASGGRTALSPREPFGAASTFHFGDRARNGPARAASVSSAALPTLWPGDGCGVGEKQRECARCGKALYRPRSNQKFCPSGACRNAAWRAEHPRGKRRRSHAPRLRFEDRVLLESLIGF
jgi:hypothetical protein